MLDTFARTRLRAAGCLIDLDAEVLLDERGEPVPLRPRAWQVLRHLAERAGRLVSKDELISAVWPDGMITDNSLVQAVADIRRALGPSAERALRTVPRRGYMLLIDAQPGAATTTLGEKLRAQAARRFVGREAELAALQPAMALETPAQALFFVHGPGGIGKSTLLERLRPMAQPGVDVVCVNGAELMPTPQGVIEGMAAALGLHESPASLQALATAWATRGRCVLLLDTFEALEPVAGWMRDTWLPCLPDQVSVVLAGRRAPDSRWSAHPLWASAMRTVALGMLAPPICARLAQAHGAPEALCAELARRARGLPLAAVMLAAEARRTGSLPDDLGEELVRALTRRCLEQAPSAAHREALLACALARRATRELLSHLFDVERAETLFEWLAAQGFVVASRDGLALHDLMREALLVDTTWCDRDRFRQLRRMVARFLAGRMNSRRAAWETTVDFFFSLRHSPAMRHLYDFDGFERVQAGLALADEHEAVRRLAARLLPASETDPLTRWLDHPAGEVLVARDEDGLILGTMVIVRLDALTQAEADRDPVTGDIRRALAEAQVELRPGTHSYLVRHLILEDGFRAPSPAQTALIGLGCTYNTDPSTGLIAIVAPRLPHALDMFIDSFDWRILPGLEWSLEGTEYFACVRNWQAEPWPAWLDRRIGKAEASGW